MNSIYIYNFIKVCFLMMYITFNSLFEINSIYSCICIFCFIAFSSAMCLLLRTAFYVVATILFIITIIKITSICTTITIYFSFSILPFKLESRWQISQIQLSIQLDNFIRCGCLPTCVSSCYL